MARPDTVSSQKIEGFEVTTSPIHGRGLRSLKACLTGESLFVVHGRPVTLPFNTNYRRGANWIGIGWETWLSLKRGSPIRFMNHSCAPNAVVSEGLVVKAIDNIEAGAEIVLDYATTEIDPSWRFRCRCRATQCRKEIRSYPFLPEAMRRRYAPHLAAAFLEAAQRVRPA